MSFKIILLKLLPYLPGANELIFFVCILFQILDMSYNNLCSNDLLTLGLLPNLKVLHVTGNQLRSLPQDLGRPYQKPDRYGLVV